MPVTVIIVVRVFVRVFEVIFFLRCLHRGQSSHSVKQAQHTGALCKFPRHQMAAAHGTAVTASSGAHRLKQGTVRGRQ